MSQITIDCGKTARTPAGNTNRVTTLEVVTDNMAVSTAVVSFDIGEAYRLTDVVAAAMQQDAEGAAKWRPVLAKVAPALYLSIRDDRASGRRYAELTVRSITSGAADGVVVGRECLRLTGTDAGILRRAAEVGLANAGHERIDLTTLRPTCRTVSGRLAQLTA